MGCKYNYNGTWLTESELFTEYQKSNNIPISTRSRELPKEYNKSIETKLKKAFNRAGVNVNIVANSTLSSVGRVIEGDNFTKIIEYNPDLIHNNGIYHEFGHLLIDLIQDDEFIKTGIDQLRGTELWNTIEALHPDLDQNLLGKEVLTTAIAEEAVKLHTTDTAQKNWLYWLNRFFEKLLSFLSLSVDRSTQADPKNIVKDLAKQLVSGHIRYSLDRRRYIVEQHMRLHSKEQLLENTSRYLNEKLNTYQIQLKQFENVANRKYIKDLEKVSDSVRVLMNKKDIADLMLAITSTMEHDIKYIKQLELKSLSLIEKYYDKSIDLNNVSLEEIYEFATILHNIRMFTSAFDPVKGIVTIPEGELEKLDFEDKELAIKLNSLLISLQKQMLPRVTNLYNNYDRLKAKFIAYILSHTSNPEKAGSNFDAWAEELLRDGFHDESKIQALLDAVMDSNEAFSANFIKLRRIVVTDAEFAAQAKSVEFKRLYKKFIENGGKIEDIVEDGFLAGQFNFAKFREDYEAVKAEKDALKLEYNYWKFVEDATKNIIPDEEYSHQRFRQIVEEQEARVKLGKNDPNRLTEYEFDTWFRKNVKEIEITDQFTQETTIEYRPKLGSIYRPLPDKYLNDSWLRIQANSNLKSFHSYMTELMEKLTEHMLDAPQKDGALPAISSDFREYEAKEDDYVFTNTAGEVVYKIPFKHIGMLQIKKVFKAPRQYAAELDSAYEQRVLLEAKERGFGEFNTLAELEEEMEKRKKENKEYHKEKLDLNIEETIPMFIYAAMVHKAKTEIETSVLVSQAIIKYEKVRRDNGFGGTTYDMIRRSVLGKRETADKFESNIANHVAKEIEMNFYERWTKTQRGDKVLKQMKNYTSLLGIGFNVFSAIKNVTYGGFMTTAEAAAGYHFDISDLHKGASHYNKNIPAMIKDASGISQEENFYLQLLKKFDVLGSIRDHYERELDSGIKHRIKKVVLGLAYFMQGTGEHMMYGSLLFTMLESHRVIDGKAQSLKQYMRSKGYDGTIKKARKDTTNEDYAQLKEQEKQLTEEFNKHKKLIESLELKDGVIVSKLDENGNEYISSFELARFKEKNRGVAHKIHGIYNKSDKGTIENTRLGELVMQFRHWARPGWVKRLGSRGGLFRIDEYWNERREETDLGGYKALWKVLTKGYYNTRDGMLEQKNKEKLSAMESGAAVLLGLLDIILHLKYYKHTMTTQELADIRRTLSEIAMLGAVLAAIAVIKVPGDDDDELKKKKWYAMLMYQLDASRAELMSFTPPGWINEGLKMLSNPTATLRTGIDIYNFFEQLLMYPFLSDHKRIIQSGVNRGEYKVVRNFGKIVPIINPIQRWLNLGKGDYRAYNYK